MMNVSAVFFGRTTFSCCWVSLRRVFAALPSTGLQPAALPFRGDSAMTTHTLLLLLLPPLGGATVDFLSQLSRFLAVGK